MKYKIITIGLIVLLLGWTLPSLALDKEEKAAIAAIRTGDLAALSFYLSQRPEVNLVFSNGKTGLYYAIRYDQFSVSAYLLSKGANPEMKSGDHSPLRWAVIMDRPRLVRLLIEYGAYVNETDRFGNTPLMEAAGLGNLELCKILIDRGADPLRTNLQNKRAGEFATPDIQSPLFRYLLMMEKQYKSQDSVPDLHDGPYIYREGEDQLIMTWFERKQEQNLTRIIEKTIITEKPDTVVTGNGPGLPAYHIFGEYVPDSCAIHTREEIFIVGDLHGRYDALVRLLAGNRVIDDSLRWTFGEGHLVLLGDVFDRGPMVTELLWYVYDLQRQARESGGNVHLILGNHEIMALTGDHRYLNEKYRYFTQYFLTDYRQLLEKNTILGAWLRSLNTILRINDNLFLHAGISPQFAIFDYSFKDINQTVRDYLNSDYRIKDGSPESIILGPIGPQWYRGYSGLASDAPEINQEFVDTFLKYKGLKRMIIAHNEQQEIGAMFDGRVISADVRIDDSGESAQGLLISGDHVFRCYPDGRRDPLD